MKGGRMDLLDLTLKERLMRNMSLMQTLTAWSVENDRRPVQFLTFPGEMLRLGHSEYRRPHLVPLKRVRILKAICTHEKK